MLDPDRSEVNIETKVVTKSEQGLPILSANDLARGCPALPAFCVGEWGFLTSEINFPTLSLQRTQGQGWGNRAFAKIPKMGVAPSFPRVLRKGGPPRRLQSARMHIKPVRYQDQRCLHFITFSCYQRMQLLDSATARNTFEQELERVRRWYGCFVAGYVVMPEHIHLLISEPERGKLSLVIQMVKQITSRKLKPRGQPRFWQVRYYDFPVWSEAKRVEKLRYIHRKPVARGLVQRPEDWKWSSFPHYAAGVEGVVEIESQWTARRRERNGTLVASGEAHPVPAKNAGTRMGATVG
jgi:putative transposase